MAAVTPITPTPAPEGVASTAAAIQASRAWRLGQAASLVFHAAYADLAAHPELNRAQIAFELAKLVITGPLAQSILED
jgi:hypothetical protein